MPRWGGWLVLVALLAGGGLAWWRLRSDEYAVTQRLREAADALSTAQGEPEMQRLLRVATFAKFLAADVLVEADAGGPTVRGRDAVAGLAAQLARAGGSRRIELGDSELGSR